MNRGAVYPLHHEPLDSGELARRLVASRRVFGIGALTGWLGFGGMAAIHGQTADVVVGGAFAGLFLGLLLPGMLAGAVHVLLFGTYKASGIISHAVTLVRFLLQWRSRADVIAQHEALDALVEPWFARTAAAPLIWLKADRE